MQEPAVISSWSLSDVIQDGLYHMGIVDDAELVRHGEKQRASLRDCLVAFQLLREPVRSAV